MAGTEYATKEDINFLMQTHKDHLEKIQALDKKIDENEAGKAYTASRLKVFEEHDTEIKTSIEQINAEIAEVKKLNQVDKQNIDTQTLRLNEIEAKKIKELEAKISVIEEQTKDYTNQEDIKFQNIKDQVNEEIQGIKDKVTQLTANAQNSPPGLGQTQTVHLGQEGDEESASEKMRELEERFDGKILSIYDRISELRSDGSKGDSRGSKLINLKDTTVEKIAENASNADVINWVDDLTLHLDGATGWNNTGAIFKALKTKKESLLDPDVMNALIDEVKDPEFDKSKFQCSERTKELFKYVFPKLSNKLKTLCCNT